MTGYNVPTCDEFRGGCKEFESLEKRDAMYRVATFLVKTWWGNPAEMADAIGVLILTWNQAFYRYGRFDFSKLENYLKTNMTPLEKFKAKDICDFSDADEKEIATLFNELLDALRISSENPKVNGRKSPVAVAKALHLLAPKFFPLWDDKIAKAYGVHYAKDPAMKYIAFCRINRELHEKLASFVPDTKWSFLKYMDEYNYAKYTYGWI